PHEFFSKATASTFELPARGDYGVGMVFMPQDAAERAFCTPAIETVVREEGQRMLGWRDVPIVESACGVIARRAMPFVRQFFVGRSDDVESGDAFERKLYVVRRR